MTLKPAYFDSLDEARKEVKRRRAEEEGNVVVKCERSPYGGYRVYSVLVANYVDGLLGSIIHKTARPQPGLYD